MSDFETTQGSSRARSRCKVTLAGWWVNRRYTRNVSSIVLAAAPSIAVFVFLIQRSFLLHDPNYADAAGA